VLAASLAVSYVIRGQMLDMDEARRYFSAASRLSPIARGGATAKRGTSRNGKKRAHGRRRV